MKPKVLLPMNPKELLSLVVAIFLCCFLREDSLADTQTPGPNILWVSDGKILKPKTPAGQHSCIKCHQRYEKRGYISREAEFAMQEFFSSLK